ncbi:hypothetical protein QQM79_16145 [Marinobacteraceae bacterium S3BR75-40.1]
MEELPRYSISPVTETDSALLDENGKRISRVPGIVLEKAFRLLDGSFLIITSDDCPFEEGFHISLIKADGSLLETTHRAIPYAPGIIKSLQVQSDNTIKMMFHDGEVVFVTVQSKASRSPSKYIQQRFRSANGIFGKHHLAIDSNVKE